MSPTPIGFPLHASTQHVYFVCTFYAPLSIWAGGPEAEGRRPGGLVLNI
jgi:hypothetical protein